MATKIATPDERLFLTDKNIEYLSLLARRMYPRMGVRGTPIILRDQPYDRDRERNAVPGLEIRIGSRKSTWRFVNDTVDHGERDYIKRTLRHYDPSDGPKAPWHMGVKEAREEAKKIAGRVVNGQQPAGRRTGRKFEDAFADYLVYLREQAEDASKPPRWMQRVARLGNSLNSAQVGQMDVGRNERAPRRGQRVVRQSEQGPAHERQSCHSYHSSDLHPRS
jgi:hypothetical protein